jgi:glycosyltransferase involved in cell wall biosynthesis
MRVLAVTRIFPNSLEPLSSPFNRQQFAALAEKCDLEVLEPIPAVPLLARFGVPARAAKLRALPREETVGGIATRYMRTFYVPRVGLGLAAPLFVASSLPHVDLVRRADVLLGTWAYPDAAATVVLARAFDKPVVVKVHGSDVNVIARRPGARAWLTRLLPRATMAVAVSRPLVTALAELGVPEDRICYVPNGVDTTLFRPRARDEARARLGVDSTDPIVLFVGRLEPAKGIDELLGAIAILRRERPRTRFVLLGDGVSAKSVREVAEASDGRVTAPGARPLAEVADWLAACDVFCLPSHREGTPNVVLEALACGRPVVATSVGGIPDIVDESVGRLVAPGDAAGLARALIDALGVPWDERFIASRGPTSWEESAAALHAVLAEARARSL